jgi:hypothetical protein
MASIDRTAYPRFRRSISVRELREAYSPSLDELEWARQMTDSDEALLSLTMCLKCCQRLGYFARFDEVPASIVGHLRQELGLHESVNPAAVPGKTVRNHRGLVRHRLGLVSDQATARKIAAEAIRAAAETKDNPADLINIALEELVKSNCELPGYTTLDRAGLFVPVRRPPGIASHWPRRRRAERDCRPLSVLFTVAGFGVTQVAEPFAQVRAVERVGTVEVDVLEHQGTQAGEVRGFRVSSAAS